MAQLNFYLRKDKKNKEGYIPVIAQFTFSGKKIRKSTGVKVLEKHWVNDRVKKPTQREPDNKYELYNKILNDFESKSNDIFDYALINKIDLTPEYFEGQWEKENPEKVKKRDILQYMDEWIDINKPVKAKRTIMGHTSARNVLAEFMQKKKHSITLDSFDLKTFEQIRKYAFEEKGFSDNYFSTLTGRYKVFMSWAMDRGLHNTLEFKKFKAPEKPKEIVCLYKDELFNLYEHQFENSRLEQVRDVYCFGCFTGLRYSDIKDLKHEHIYGDEIRKTIIKTKEFTHIPLNKYALEILTKYEDRACVLPLISEQKFNEYIKEACKIVEIDQPVNTTRYSGGKAIQETKPKYELITSHTARKTFTTNSLILGMSESVVKKITGHKKDKNFQRYVRLADSFVKKELNDHWK